MKLRKAGRLHSSSEIKGVYIQVVKYGRRVSVYIQAVKCRGREGVYIQTVKYRGRVGVYIQTVKCRGREGVYIQMVKYVERVGVYIQTVKWKKGRSLLSNNEIEEGRAFIEKLTVLKF